MWHEHKTLCNSHPDFSSRYANIPVSIDYENNQLLKKFINKNDDMKLKRQDEICWLATQASL